MHQPRVVSGQDYTLDHISKYLHLCALRYYMLCSTIWALLGLYCRAILISPNYWESLIVGLFYNAVKKNTKLKHNTMYESHIQPVVLHTAGMTLLMTVLVASYDNDTVIMMAVITGYGAREQCNLYPT